MIEIISHQYGSHKFNTESIRRLRAMMDVIQQIQTFENIPLIEINYSNVFFHLDNNPRGNRVLTACKEELDEMLRGVSK